MVQAKEGLKVLIVEDEPLSASLLEKMVRQFGASEVWCCADDTCAFETAMREAIDLIFMDLNIRGETDGIQCAKRITQHKSISIVFATSFCDGDILEEAIDLNTLNYLVKPFGKKDVEITMNLARIARRRRPEVPLAPAGSTHRLEGGIVLDTAARRVTTDTGEISLTPKEFDLLTLLFVHANHAVASETIRAQVWNRRAIAASTLRETLTRLRRKLPALRIASVHGIGYRLDHDAPLSNT